MNTGSTKTADRSDDGGLATGLRFENGRIIVRFADQREVGVPLSLYPTLARARPAQRNRWILIGPGKGFHWEELDLDLSATGIALGIREHIPPPPALPGRGKAGRSRTDSNRFHIERWILEALKDLGGSGRVLDINRIIWKRHGSEIRSAGDLVYRWQIEVQSAIRSMRSRGVVSPVEQPRGAWKLAS